MDLFSCGFLVLVQPQIAVHNDFYTQLPHPMFSSLCRSFSLVSECWSSSRGRVSCRSARDLGSPAAALSLNVLGQGAWEGSEELRDSVTASALPQKSSTSSFINADTTSCAQHRVCRGGCADLRSQGPPASIRGWLTWSAVKQALGKWGAPTRKLIFC